MWFEKLVYYFGNKLVLYLGEKYLWRLLVKSTLEKKNLYLMDELDHVYSKSIEEQETDGYVLVGIA